MICLHGIIIPGLPFLPAHLLQTLRALLVSCLMQCLMQSKCLLKYLSESRLGREREKFQLNIEAVIAA